MSDNAIYSIPELKRTVAKAKTCFIQVRYGTSETWVKIAKSEVAILIDGYDKNASPKDCGMYSGRFGETTNDGRDLYLG